MKIGGFTYVRNGFKMGYPFIASISSILPIVDELFIVVGNSEDGTREAIENLKNDKITIIDSIWEEEKRKNGEIFKEQSNIGLEKVTGDWAIHIQADEVLNEDAKDKLMSYINVANQLDHIDGLLFPFYHFWGDYQHIRNTRRTHAFEIRAFKTNRNILSYKDSQGFRIFESSSDHKGSKLRVLKTSIPIYHYSYTRNPKLMNKKSNYFHRFWHTNEWLKKHTKEESEFDFNEVDKLELFTGTHPKQMDEIIRQQDWKFEYDPSKSNMKFKNKILYQMEKLFNYRFFEYRNYKLERLPLKYQHEIK